MCSVHINKNIMYTLYYRLKSLWILGFLFLLARPPSYLLREAMFTFEILLIIDLIYTHL